MQPFPAGGIVPEDEEFDAVNKGILQYCLNGACLWKNTIPTACLFSYMITGPSALEMMCWYLAGEGLDLANEATSGTNVQVMFGFPETPEVFLYSSEELKSKEDIKGMKLRLIGDEAVIFSKLGVSPVNISSPEIYESMQRGVLDGFQHSSLSYDWKMGFHEVAPYIYISEVRQPTDPQLFGVNKDAWNELPDDLKQLVQDEFIAQGIKYYTGKMYADTSAAKQFLDYGSNLLQPPADLEEALVQSAQEFYADESAKDPLFAKIAQSIMDFKEASRSTFARL